MTGPSPHLVDDHNIVAARQQGVRHPAADEAGRTGNQDGLLPGVRRHLIQGKTEKKKKERLTVSANEIHPQDGS